MNFVTVCTIIQDNDSINDNNQSLGNRRILKVGVKVHRIVKKML